MAEHGAAILRVCRALLPPHDAEDAWSETFLAALRAYPELPQGAAVQAWLVTIAQRKAIDSHRAARRRPAPVAEVPTEADAPGNAPDPHEYDDLWAAVRALPPAQRAAVAHHHLAGLPYADVAAITGSTEAAARRAAADGIRSLRGRFARSGRGSQDGQRKSGRT